MAPPSPRSSTRWRPSAKLQLYCIADTTGFQQAEQDIVSHGIPIVNSSLSFPGDSRGDGTGDATSAAATVQAAARPECSGSRSAGNSAQDHWSGTFADGDRDGYTDLNGTAHRERAGRRGGPTWAERTRISDLGQWPQSSAPVTLVATPFKCDPSGCQPRRRSDPLSGPELVFRRHRSGSRPVLSLNLPNNTTSNNFEWVIQVKQGSGTPGAYDLSYYGDVGPSLLSVARATESGGRERRLAGIVAVRTGGGRRQRREQVARAYSSQGPTIDRRVKPDITGFDNVASNLDQFSSFSGTSAGAPHVAGAAALIKSANSNLDAAPAGATREPGHGDCRGRPADQSVGPWAVGARFPSASYRAGRQQLPAVVHAERVFDSRTRSGAEPLGTGEQVTVALTGAPAGRPLSP